MGADLSLHVLGPYKYKSWETGGMEDGEATEQDYKDLNATSLGSKYFAGFCTQKENTAWERAYHNLGNSPQVWVGEVSWLKAALFEDPDTFIPDPVAKVVEIIGEDFPIIDDELIAKIKEAMGLNNKTSYSIASDSDIITFLEEHKGKKVVAESW